MLTRLCHLCLSPQYYEMSYGLNIEMHKQVRKITFSVFFGVCVYLCLAVWKLHRLSRWKKLNVLCVCVCGFVLYLLAAVCKVISIHRMNTLLETWFIEHWLVRRYNSAAQYWLLACFSSSSSGCVVIINTDKSRVSKVAFDEEGLVSFPFSKKQAGATSGSNPEQWMADFSFIEGHCTTLWFTRLSPCVEHAHEY